MKIVPCNVVLRKVDGTELDIVNAARVSFHKESVWENDADGWKEGVLQARDKKLIEYLAKHNHWTPFGHVGATFVIKAPLFVARQLGKHQVGLVWNEVSRRYVDEEPEFFLPGKGQWRQRAENVKQGSGVVGAKIYSTPGHEDLWGDIDNEYDPDLYADLITTNCLELYTNMIAGGVAPEQARMILPQNTMTEWWWTGSLAAFARIFNLRLDPHTQKETQEVAQTMYNLLLPAFPNALPALMKGTQ